MTVGKTQIMQTRRQTLGGVLRPQAPTAANKEDQVSRRTSLGDYYNKRFGAAAGAADSTFPNNDDTTAPIQKPGARKVNSILRPANNNARRFDENHTGGDLGGGALRSARKVRPTLGGEDMPVVASRMSMMMVAQDKRDFQTVEGRSLGIRRVIEFLSSRSYGHSLSEQELTSPTVTAFKQLLFSILSLLDLETAQNLRIKAKEKGGGGWENAVCLLFRQIKYPFTLSPKQINAVGSANAWPKFLGALVWLCDLVDVGEVEIEAQLFNAERTALMTDLTTAYFNYMDGDDSALDHVMGKLAQSVDLQVKEANRRLEEARGRNAELEQSYLKLAAPPSAADDDVSFADSLVSLGKQLETLASDRMQMEKNLPVWRTKHANASSALQASTAKLLELQQIKEQTEEKRRLEEEKMNSQVLKNADLTRLAAERANVERMLAETENEHAEQSRQNWTVKEQNEQEGTQVDLKRSDLVSRLKLLSQQNHMPIGNKLFDLAEKQVEHNTCELFLKELHNRLMQRIARARNDALDLKSKSDQNEEQSSQVELRVERLRADVKRWEEKHVHVERETQSELDALQREIDREKEVKFRFDQVQQCVEEENEVRRMRMELETHRQEWFRESSALEERIRNALLPVVGTKERLELIMQPTSQALHACEEDMQLACKNHLDLVKRAVATSSVAH